MIKVTRKMDPFHTSVHIYVHLSTNISTCITKNEFKARVDLQKKKSLSHGILFFFFTPIVCDLLFVTCIPLDAYKDDGVGEVTPSRRQKNGGGVVFFCWWTDLSDFFSPFFVVLWFCSIFFDIFEDGNGINLLHQTGIQRLEVLRLNGDRGEGCQGQSLTGMIACHPFWGIKQAANPWDI